MSRPLIEFHSDHPDYFPAPFPATRGVPQWLKDMPTERLLEPEGGAGGPGSLVPTVKQCPPFLEAMTCGYLMPLAGDVTFTRESSGVLSFTASGKFIETQHVLQVRGSPFQGLPIVKFMSPWVVRTPPGYSTLFLPPLNTFGSPFQVLSGLVETDTYYRPVHFPTACLLRPGASVTLRRGQPIAQLIPIRREEWQSKAEKSDEAARRQIETEMAARRHNFYKDLHWKKKGYG